jgi:hypothetical protein
LAGKFPSSGCCLSRWALFAKRLSLVDCTIIISARLPDKAFFDIYPVFSIILPGEITPSGTRSSEFLPLLSA